MEKFSLKIKSWLCLMTFIASLCSPFSSFAAGNIQSVSVTGNSKIDSSTIESAIQTKAGSVYSREKVNQDIKNIYELGLFSEVQADKQESSSGIKLVYIVTEKPIISRIVIEGSKEVSKNKIEDEITQKPFQVLDEKKVSESKEKIKQLYTKEGLGFASINTEVRSISGKNEADLVFKITENKGAQVRKISFDGNTVFSSGKLRRMMKTKEKGILSFLTGSGKYRDEAIERDVAFITYQYLNQGYIKAQVDKPIVTPIENGKGVELKFRINEGLRYKVRNITFSGDVLTTPEEILARFDTLKGNYYSHKLMESDLQKINDLYGNQGYAFANIRPQPFPDDATKEVDININVEKGQKITVEKINITGNTITRDKVIRRELKVTENSLYSEDLVRKSKQRLEALGYFSEVEFSTPKGSSDDKLVLNINVKEKPTGSFSVGAGYSSAESFLLTASISKQNFMGLGINGSVLAEVSKKRQQFSLQYFDPYFLDSRFIFSGNISKLLTRFDDFDRDALGGEVNIGRQLFDYTSFSLGYRIEDVKVDNFSLVVPEFFKKNTSGITSSLLFSVSRDTRNNRITATKGTFNQFSLEWAGLGGSNKFLRMDGNSRFFLPVPFPKGSVLKANARIGYIQSLENDPVPLFERYFTGGINSLRGFTPRSIGPSVQIPPSPTGADTNFIYGGNKLLVMNLEYEFPIYDPAGFRGVVFLDAGNAYAEEQKLNPLNIRANYGFGVRWNSPFGPLRFEWGLPFKRKAGEDKIVFNFTIGTLF
ncbi:MAG: outer membrane protein assembly factor BamA [Deltaproteobacteria bacterium]|nr:outer membrane protein assembly factor BamA [Deltaproteobacteria bacterium]